VDTIKMIVPQLIKHGKLIRPGLGIGIVPDSMRQRMIQSDRGLIISTIVQDGGAAQAGLRGMTQDKYGRVYLGDIILKVDSQEVNNLDDIYQVLEKKKIGDLVNIEYSREGKIQKTQVRLKAVSSE
jgi:S1-C subfamily serine protease